MGQYAHGNEPSHHTIYLFQYAGRPDRTAELAREVCDRFYKPEPEGLCGNDDCGQMSAWYLFSAMGFYPLNPCGGDYVLGAPQVPKVVLHIPGAAETAAPHTVGSRVPRDRMFTVIAKNLSKENKYVKSVTLNGKPLTGKAAVSAAEVPVLRHADIMRGGELVFDMTGAQVPPPAFVTQEDAFEEKCDGAFWHVQGIAISDDAVYCGLLKNIVKFDLATGKCLKGVSAPYHTGDVCWHNGRLYTSVLSNFEAARKNPSDGRGVIQVYDADLNLIREQEFPMGSDGIAALDGVLYLGRGANVERDGKLYTPHVLNSTSRTCEPDAWTTVEAEVRGGERIIHRVDGRTVLEYEKPQYDPRDGSAKKLIEAAGGDLILRGGTISIQSESAPTDFKSILVRVRQLP